MDVPSNRTLGLAALLAMLVSALTVWPVVSDDLQFMEKIGGFVFGAVFLALPYLVLLLFGRALHKRWTRLAIIVAMAVMLGLWLWVWYITFIDITSPDAQDALAMVVLPVYGAGAALIVGLALKLAERFQS